MENTFENFETLLHKIANDFFIENSFQGVDSIQAIQDLFIEDLINKINKKETISNLLVNKSIYVYPSLNFMIENQKIALNVKIWDIENYSQYEEGEIETTLDLMEFFNIQWELMIGLNQNNELIKFGLYQVKDIVSYTFRI